MDLKASRFSDGPWGTRTVSDKTLKLMANNGAKSRPNRIIGVGYRVICQSRVSALTRIHAHAVVPLIVLYPTQYGD